MGPFCLQACFLWKEEEQVFPPRQCATRAGRQHLQRCRPSRRNWTPRPNHRFAEHHPNLGPRIWTTASGLTPRPKAETPPPLGRTALPATKTAPPRQRVQAPSAKALQPRPPQRILKVSAATPMDWLLMRRDTTPKQPTATATLRVPNRCVEQRGTCRGLRKRGQRAVQPCPKPRHHRLRHEFPRGGSGNVRHLRCGTQRRV